MDERLKANMRFLCDESRMLTGVTVAYGTPIHLFGTVCDGK